MRQSMRAVVCLSLFTLSWLAPDRAQGQSTWFLAEGANNEVFTEEILVGNPSASTLAVTVALLPEPGAVAAVTSKVFTLGPTSRLTVRLTEDFGLVGASSARVSAVLAGTSTPADIVVERTMWFPDGSRPGAHNAGGVARLAPKWTLAEGATGTFDTFVLAANPNPTTTRVRATYLTADGTEYVSEVDAAPNGRVTFWPRIQHPPLAATEFSTFVESLTAGNDIVAERAMYFDGLRSGHDAVGVSEASATWLFAEGFTGNNGQSAFETFLLLANTSTEDASVTVDYLLDSNEVVTRVYPVGARRRYTVWVDREGREVDARLEAAAFGIRVTSTVPIVAERAVYWGTPSPADRNYPALPWVEGPRHDAFYLLANPNPAAIAVRATFVREDGYGIVRETCVGGRARATIWTAGFPELIGRRFAAFLESVPSSGCGGATGGEGFVAERAMYSGPGWAAGHVNVGTPLAVPIATPPVPPVAPPPPPPPPPAGLAVASVSPSVGRLGGGQPIVITGTGFQPGARVVFSNPSWTADRNLVLPSLDEATHVAVSADGKTITARTPARGFYTGYQTAGPATLRVINPGGATADLSNGYTFVLNVLAFGDDFVYGATDGGGRAGRPFPQRLQDLLAGYGKAYLNPATGAPSGGSALQFGGYVRVTNAGLPGECVSSAGGNCAASAGSDRFPSLADAVSGSADAYDAIVLLEGVFDVRAGLGSGAARNGLRSIIVAARDRGIVPIVTRLTSGTNLISSGALSDLGNQIWALTEENLGLEIYRQSLDGIAGGAYPSQDGYDRIAQLVFEKVAREFPLQACDARADKPGKGCPRNP